MVQLKVLSGKMAGTETVVRHFPFRVGRSAEANLRAEEEGVWEQHLELSFDRETGFSLVSHPEAQVSVNGQVLRETVLRNGDVIEAGALKIRFWLSPTRQYRLTLREWLTWIGFAVIAAVQLALIYWLLR